MNWDFSNEEEQTEFAGKTGPIPAGSVVMVELGLLEPYEDSQALDDPLIKVARSGLRQLYVELKVILGEYADYSWRQHITLPASMQNISLSAGQETACKIGGAMLKAMLQAAKKPAISANGARGFHGLRFPVRVRINPRPMESKHGTVYWVNEIARVITQDMPEYAEISSKGELINPQGATTGQEASRSNGQKQAPPKTKPLDPFPSESSLDEVPF